MPPFSSHHTNTHTHTHTHTHGVNKTQCRAPTARRGDDCYIWRCSLISKDSNGESCILSISCLPLAALCRPSDDDDIIELLIVSLKLLSLCCSDAYAYITHTGQPVPVLVHHARIRLDPNKAVVSILRVRPSSADERLF
mmetsp:Transcript_29548/g.47369  ORF Transcript_29548/g.47369 Transcript_29548/m.47369 type:complete len:139 (+) Transcript_29548:2308-2724(+)